MMRLIGSVVLLLAMVVTARGHFVFLIPSESSRLTQAVFSDELKPDDAKFLKNIAHTKFYAVVEDKLVALDVTTGKEALEVTPPGKQPTWVYAVCPYGVLTKGKDTFLLTYYARSLIGAKASAVPAAKTSTTMKLDILPNLDAKDGPVAQVLWDGKPVAGAEVVLYVPGKDDQLTTKTDEDGMVKLTPATKAGLYAIRARHMAETKGKYKEKEYTSARTYCTCTFGAEKMK